MSDGLWIPVGYGVLATLVVVLAWWENKKFSKELEDFVIKKIEEHKNGINE